MIYKLNGSRTGRLVQQWIVGILALGLVLSGCSVFKGGEPTQGEQILLDLLQAAVTAGVTAILDRNPQVADEMYHAVKAAREGIRGDVVVGLSEVEQLIKGAVKFTTLPPDKQALWSTVSLIVKLEVDNLVRRQNIAAPDAVKLVGGSVLAWIEAAAYTQLERPRYVVPVL